MAGRFLGELGQRVWYPRSISSRSISCGKEDTVRFLFCSLESPGFLYPSIGIAKELARRGHEVAFVSDVQAAPTLSQAGLDRLPRGDGDSGSFQVRQWFQPLSVSIQVKHIEYALETFTPDVLIGQSLTFGPLIVAERRKLPVGLIGFCTYLWPAPGQGTTEHPGSEGERRAAWRHGDMLKWLNQARCLFRLPLCDGSPQDTPLLGDLFLLRSVPELETDSHRLPERVHLVGTCLWEPESADGELENWLAATWSSKLPLVYVQHGRFFDLPSFWPRLTMALAHLPCRVAASTGRLDGDVGSVPESFFVRPHVPQQAVLRTARVVVASANTTAVLGALSAGIPSLLIPGGGEQPDVANLCLKAGVAKVLRPEEATPEAIGDAIAELLADEHYRSRAAAYALALAKVDGCAASADLLEILATTRKPVLRDRRY